MATIALTTNPGLEDLALDEVRARASESGLTTGEALLPPQVPAGHLSVEIEGPAESVLQLILGLRSVHRAVRTVVAFSIEDPDPLEQIAAQVAAHASSIPELAPPEVCFRVTSARTGTHAFTSEDVARMAGAGVRRTLRRAVRMKGFDVELRCDVRDRSCVLGVQLNRNSLSRRSSGPYTQRTSLRANLAWALLELARPDSGDPPRKLLDPFVGAGTLLEEAAARWPGVRLCGGDKFEGPATGAWANLEAAGLLGRSEIRLGDARALEEHWPEGGFDTLVTNPPFGKRLGQQIELRGFYTEFLRSADRVATPDARMVVLVQRRAQFNQAVSAVDGWSIRHVRIVELGGLYAGAFLLSRPS